MATYYAVATGNWTAAAVWALSSGGAGGAGVPTATDDVVFDSGAAPNVTVPATGGPTCRTLTINGFIGTITVVSGSSVVVTGNVAVQTTGWTMAGLATLGNAWLQMTGVTKTLQTSGKDLGGVYVSATTASVALLDALVTSAGPAVVRSDGGFDTGSFNVTAGTFQSSVNATRTVTFGTSTITLSAGGTALNMADTRGLTFSAASSTIVFTGTSPTMNVGATAGSSGVTFGIVRFNGAAGTTSISTSATVPLTFGTLERNGPNAATDVVQFSGFSTVVGGVGVTHTITNLNISSFGTTPATRVWFKVVAGLHGTQVGLNVTSAVTITNGADFMDIGFSGAAGKNWSARTDVGDCGGNSGATFPASVTNYWVGGATGGNGWAVAAHWASSSGGAASSGRIPLPQDDVRFDANSGLTGANSVLVNVMRMGRNIDFTGVVAIDIQLGLGSQGLFGSLTFASGVVQVSGGAAALVFYGRSGGTITSAGKDFLSAQFSIQAGTGKYTLADALTVSAAAFVITDGIFDSAGFTVTVGSGYTHNGGSAWWRNSTVIHSTTVGITSLNPGAFMSRTVLRITNTSSSSTKTLGPLAYGEVRLEGGSTTWALQLALGTSISQLTVVGTNKTLKLPASTASGSPAISAIVNSSGAPFTIASVTAATRAGIRPGVNDVNGIFAGVIAANTSKLQNNRLEVNSNGGSQPYSEFPGYNPADGPQDMEIEADVSATTWPVSTNRSIVGRNNLGGLPNYGFDLSISTTGAVVFRIAHSSTTASVVTSPSTIPSGVGAGRFTVKTSYVGSTGVCTFSYSTDGGATWTSLGSATASNGTGIAYVTTYAALFLNQARDLWFGQGAYSTWVGNIYRAQVFGGIGGARTYLGGMDATIVPSYDVNASVTDSDASIGGGWWNSNGTDGGNNLGWTFNSTLRKQSAPPQRPALVRASRW